MVVAGKTLGGAGTQLNLLRRQPAALGLRQRWCGTGCGCVGSGCRAYVVVYPAYIAPQVVLDTVEFCHAQPVRDAHPIRPQAFRLARQTGDIQCESITKASSRLGPLRVCGRSRIDGIGIASLAEIAIFNQACEQGGFRACQSSLRFKSLSYT